MLKRRTQAKLIVAAFAGAAALALPTPASAATAESSGARAYTWSSDTRVKLCDIAADSRAVRSNFNRRGTNTNYQVNESRGNGNCSDSPADSRLVYRLNACHAGPGGVGWWCSSWAYTGH
ncbi:hypothetical protein QQG74_27015 [Micromonospora sp. FIMYZ51]|uniref:hypothetical protein n=1 Tax=Micromonospora sp. FIMYZ51 TaxID=3051832 RepID=UPI00311F5822